MFISLLFHPVQAVSFCACADASWGPVGCRACGPVGWEIREHILSYFPVRDRSHVMKSREKEREKKSHFGNGNSKTLRTEKSRSFPGTKRDMFAL